MAEKASWCHKVTELNVRLLTRHFRICGKEEHLLGPTVTFLTYRYFKNLYKTLKFELLYAFELKPYEHAPILSVSSHNLLACCHAPSSEVSIWLHFVCVCVWMCVCVCVDLDADSSPVAVARVKALIWMIIQDSKRVLTHPSNTQGVTGWRQADGGVKWSPESLSVYPSLSQSNVLQD